MKLVQTKASKLLIMSEYTNLSASLFSIAHKVKTQPVFKGKALTIEDGSIFPERSFNC